MIGPLDLFDLAAANRAKHEALDRVEKNAAGFCAMMRQIARNICAAKGFVTTDDLQEAAQKRGITPHSKNAWGAIFRGKDWTPAGYTRTIRETGHARTIRIWQFNEAPDTEKEAHAQATQHASN